ncbi:UDP-glycosyltransferase UGT5-like [Schistocerca serialis cubense]|uniref:UDP-glycosyltransferase UGT5-like n=1 Tax=Schistocerca serialis cubense TaxID=2023355 RepID=UPI00214E8C5C|nr:UDP-glycosyltransferase UGT5-like [Schistocerca serialis cubense]
MGAPWRHLLVAAACLSASTAARILAVYSVPAWSHWNVFRPLLWELAERGHHVTILTSHRENQPHPNWTVAPVGEHLDLMPGAHIDIFSFGANKIDMVRRLMRYGERSCPRLMEEPEVQRLLASPDDSFDLLIAELFFNDCLLVLAHKFRVPIVGTCPFEGAPWMDDMVANPQPPASVPYALLDYGRLDSLLDRALNAAYGALVRAYRRHVYLPAVDAVVQKYVPGAPPLADLERTTSLVMINWHLSFNRPRPMLPNVVGYGGMHIKAPKALPQNIQKFLDDAENGAIYFSLGTNVKSTVMKNETKLAFAEAFSRLKQRVLWKVDEDELPKQPSNAMTSKWLPQQDILAHKNVRLFMTHGGLMSIQEAIYHAKPIIGFPVFGDQFHNMNRAEELGFGIKITFANISLESITWAVSEVLETSSYREAVQHRSRLFRDSPRTPLEEAVYWIEYVIRHKGAQHMRSGALDLSWFQLLLLDVVGAIILVTVILLFSVSVILRLLLRTIRHVPAVMTKKKVSKRD